MKVKGINKCYAVEITNVKNNGIKRIAITLSAVDGSLAVMISKKNWDKLKRNE